MNSLFGMTPFAWDDFNRPDQAVVTGSISASGHEYRQPGVDPYYIKDGRLWADVEGPGGSIAYLRNLPLPIMGIAGKFEFFGNTTPLISQNAVIGTADIGFGAGSIQLAVWPGRWQLFAVQNPISDPYPVLASGTFDVPLVAGVAYEMSMYYVPEKSAVIVCPPLGAFPVYVEHPFINEYWGAMAGFQERRQQPAFGDIAFDEVSVFDAPVIVSAGTGGDNYITGTVGDEAIFGQGGNDQLFGNDGFDVIGGGTGNDTIYGQGGNDWLGGNEGNDYIHGGAGNDRIEGHGGDDVILGGNDNDTVLGGAGNDNINGGFGNDTMDGGGGNDVLRGSTGGDTFVFNAGLDTVLDLNLDDAIHLTASLGVGGMTGADIVSTFGTFDGDDFVLTFGADVLRLDGAASLGAPAIADLIDVI